MKRRVIHFGLAATLLALTACSGGGEDESSLTSRFARAATRTLVDVVRQIEDVSPAGDSEGQPAEPLRLAASRPDSILEQPISTASSAAEETAVPDRHVVIATVLPEPSGCGGAFRIAPSRTVSGDGTQPDRVGSPVTRTRSATLTRI